MHLCSNLCDIDRGSALFVRRTTPEASRLGGLAAFPKHGLGTGSGATTKQMQGHSCFIAGVGLHE